jgi:solute carrier family 35 protein E3
MKSGEYSAVDDQSLEDLKEDDKKEQTKVNAPSQKIVLVWMAVNLFATIGIVFTNKTIFNDPSLVHMQVSFTAFHFLCTSATLFVASKFFGAFEPKPIGLVNIAPLCFAFCGNVILPNLSLANSSVTFYQLCRILLTPGTAFLNFCLFGIWISFGAAMSIIPICVGVAITTYFEAIASTVSSRSTSVSGVIFALSGVICSSLYTVWIATFAKKYKCSSMQLLFNQAPVSVLLLILVIPLFDTIPDLSKVEPGVLWLVLLSGVFAMLINVSQFFIIHGTSALSSTIVGHAKTCSIVVLGWFFGQQMHFMSIFGVILSVGGIMVYSSLNQKPDTLETTSASVSSRKKVATISVVGLLIVIGFFTFASDLVSFQKTDHSGGNVKILVSLISDHDNDDAYRALRHSAEILNNSKSDFILDCLAFSSGSVKGHPKWLQHLEIEQQSLCPLTKAHKKPFSYLLKFIDPFLLQKAGYSHVLAIRDTILLDDSFDLQHFLQVAIRRRMAVASPAISNAEFETLKPKPSGPTVWQVNVVGLQATLFTIDAWECYYELIDTEYVNEGGAGLWFNKYCGQKMHVLNNFTGVLIPQKSRPLDLVVENSMIARQEDRWNSTRGVKLERAVVDV